MIPSLKSKVLVAMSGGVDSCVAGAMLAEAGHDVVGITMRVVAEEEHRPVFQPCCSAEMAKDAREVAEKFGFPHYTLNLVSNFQEQVIDDFTSEYLMGRTPNPCIRCNQRLKYGTLFKKAMELDADYIATGHYVRMAKRGDRFCVRRPVDLEKDQSYVMAGLSQKQLATALFPLGEMTKEETRAKARALGLRAAETPESQDICFIPDNDYKGFLRRRIGETESGPIVTVDGKVLGRHTGLTDYTVGQRKGLGIAAPRPLYVIRLEPERNALVVGFEEETFCQRFTAKEIVWGGLAAQDGPFDCFAQIRYHHETAPCTVRRDGSTFQVEFHVPQRAVTPGQWAVFYDDEDRVLAAGIVNEFEPLSVPHEMADAEIS